MNTTSAFPAEAPLDASGLDSPNRKVLVWDGGYDENAGIVEEMADVFVL